MSIGNSEIKTENNRNTSEISIKEIILKLREWYRYLLSKWIILLLFGSIGALCGFLYATYKKPLYTATTTFVLESGESSGGGLGQYAGLASMVGIDIGGGGGGIFQGDNILELYKSRIMIEKSLFSLVQYKGKTQFLLDCYIDFKKLKKAWEKSPDLEHLKFLSGNDNSPTSRLQDSVVGTIVNDINKNFLVVGKPDKKLSIIKVEVKAPDEFFAKAFNEQIVRNVNDFYSQTKTKKSLNNVSILQKKTDSVRRVMNGDIYTAAAVVDATPNLNPTRQLQRIVPTQRSQFSAETNKAVLGEMVKNLELSKLSLLKEAPLIQVIDQPKLPLERYKLSRLTSLLIGGFLGVMIISMFFLIRLLLDGLKR